MTNQVSLIPSQNALAGSTFSVVTSPGEAGADAQALRHGQALTEADQYKAAGVPGPHPAFSG